jgi:uncharacterized membrane protein YhiD involved in acid resistance
VLLSSLSSSCVTKVFCGVCVAVTFLSCAFVFFVFVLCNQGFLWGKKPWLHRTKTKKTKAQERKVTATQTPQKTLVTQDEDKDKSTRQKSNSNTDPTKNLGYTGRRQRRQKLKTEK